MPENCRGVPSADFDCLICVLYTKFPHVVLVHCLSGTVYLVISKDIFIMSSMTFGQKVFKVTPPEKGSFPLDHEGSMLIINRRKCLKNLIFYNIAHLSDHRSLSEYIMYIYTHKPVYEYPLNYVYFYRLIVTSHQWSLALLDLVIPSTSRNTWLACSFLPFSDGRGKLCNHVVSSQKV